MMALGRPHLVLTEVATKEHEASVVESDRKVLRLVELTMLNVTIETHRIRIGSRFSISFQRTLRIPDDGRTYPLPPGLGVFSLSKIEDYRDCVPAEWHKQGGAFIPMYQREALWLGFDATPWRPSAVKVSIGKINAVSGEPDDDRLHATPQDYVVCPPQLWLDGINAGHGRIRQFVAMPLGLGYTVEAALTGSEEIGGIQIVVFDPKPGRFPDEPPPTSAGSPGRRQPLRMATAQTMGLGAGGVMKQKIYPDSHGIDTWDQDNSGRVVVHLLNSEHFREITGTAPPPPPIAAQVYTKHGFPWFELYDESRGDVAPPERLTTVKSIAEHDREHGTHTEDHESLEVPDTQIKKLGDED
jgi:hypothetical protein